MVQKTVFSKNMEGLWHFQLFLWTMILMPGYFQVAVINSYLFIQAANVLSSGCLVLVSSCMNVNYFRLILYFPVFRHIHVDALISSDFVEFIGCIWQKVQPNRTRHSIMTDRVLYIPSHVQTMTVMVFSWSYLYILQGFWLYGTMSSCWVELWRICTVIS